MVDEGSGVRDEHEMSELLKKFVHHVKRQKIVQLEELAVTYEMTTQEVVDHLKALDASGELPGVIDDRGKFVHVSAEELELVAAFVTRKGRVTAADIARECNRVIDLTPSVDESELFVDSQPPATV
eukprot:TRINITY_DN6456_c0_g1_i2.p1 TRINITY_DN6456_c0_g1~~TRINITY_DN6456_c0_g1_i2.p1  ORF type:complete len:126 (+),score=55.05 TRINITY_DN6456_c0_g1_i2:415-792(+)